MEYYIFSDFLVETLDRLRIRWHPSEDHGGIRISDLPEINTILISHNHYDHLDYKTIKKFHTYEEDTDDNKQKIVPKHKKIQFNVYVRYKAQLKSYSKKSFDLTLKVIPCATSFGLPTPKNTRFNTWKI